MGEATFNSITSLGSLVVLMTRAFRIGSNELQKHKYSHLQVDRACGNAR